MTSLLLERFSETNEERNKPTEWCCFAQTRVDNLTIQTYLFLYRKLREENLRTCLSFLTREFKMYDATEATTSLKIVSELVKENSNSRLCVRVLMQSFCFCSLNYAKFVALSLLSRRRLGSLSNHDDDDNKNVTNLHIWQWKTMVLHSLQVHFFHFWTFRRRSCSFHDVKWPVLQLCGWAYDDVQFCLIYEALVSA